MGFLPLLPSCGKSGKRMNYGIFATFAIMWQKWQKDELWDFCHLPSCGKNGKRMNSGIFATFAIMWQKWQKDELGIFATFAICGKSGKRDELWDFCHHVAKVAKG